MGEMECRSRVSFREGSVVFFFEGEMVCGSRKWMGLVVESLGSFYLMVFVFFVESEVGLEV